MLFTAQKVLVCPRRRNNVVALSETEKVNVNRGSKRSEPTSATTQSSVQTLLITSARRAMFTAQEPLVIKWFTPLIEEQIYSIYQRGAN